VKELNLNLEDRRLRLTLELAKQLIGTPRHLSQHPGGFVLTEDRLDDLVPIEPAAMKDRQVIEWDKDDIESLKFMKVDVLGLGMLGCMRRAFDLLAEHKGERHDLSTIPAEDEATLKACGVAAIYTPKNFQLNDIMAGLVKLADPEAAGFVPLSKGEGTPALPLPWGEGWDERSSTG